MNTLTAGRFSGETVARPAPTAQGAEEVLQFRCETQELLGVVSIGNASNPVGVVIVVGGPQYRAGSHRQFVHLARCCAAAGFTTLRFDYRGMGDSSGELRDFEQVDADIAAALDAMQSAHPGLSRFVLWGLCDAASAALMFAARRPDPRLAGLALLNPWVRSETSLAKAQVKHYYLQRLRQREFWTKLFSGRLAWSAVSGLAANLKLARGAGSAVAREAAFQDVMARGWMTSGVPILLLICEADITAREFMEYTASSPAWGRALAARTANTVHIPNADHTCSTPAARQAMEAATLQWLSTTFGEPR